MWNQCMCPSADELIKKMWWVYMHTYVGILGFPGGSEAKASAWNAGDPGSIPGSGYWNTTQPIIKNENFAIFTNMDRLGEHYAGRKKSDREREILHDIA